MGILVDLTGKRFGSLVVLRKMYPAKNRHMLWECRCDCGVLCIKSGKYLKNGDTKSCGCALDRHRKSFGDSNRAISTTHGMTNTRTFRIWQGMKARCKYPNLDEYKHYGGRGITYCERWNDFENFLEDMGEVPVGMTLDRIDNNGNYEKSNCRFATPIEQANNKRTNVNITYNGETKTLAQWADVLGIHYQTLRDRLKTWTIECAFNTPVRGCKYIV